jgi:hypothetical protein
VKLVLKKRTARLSLLLAVGVLAVGVSGCGIDNRTDQTGVSQDELSAGAEPYFWVGQITYQVQVSRQLNPFDATDVEYLTGVAGAQNISPQQFWFGVFLWAKNQSGHQATTTDNIKLVDSQGQVFLPTKLNANVNLYAWTPTRLAPDAIEPLPGSTASNGSTGGGLVLFKLTQSVYSNRPLTLLMYAPGSTKPSRISLDL